MSLLNEKTTSMTSRLSCHACVSLLLVRMPSSAILRKKEPKDELEDCTNDIDCDNRFEYCC